MLNMRYMIIGSRVVVYDLADFILSSCIPLASDITRQKPLLDHQLMVAEIHRGQLGTLLYDFQAEV